MKNRILMVLLVLLILATFVLASCEKECKHQFIQNEIEPTCGEQGYIENICLICGYMYQDNIKPADPSLGHSLALENSQLPTCLNEGWEKYICTECGYTETKYLEALGHSYGSWNVDFDATCLETGLKVRVCATCGNEQTSEIAAKGHSFGQWEEAQAPTCTQEGYDARTCRSCGLVETRAISATGHNMSAWYHPNNYSCDMRTDCSRCNYYEIKSEQHRWYPETIINAPTCTEEGFTTDVCMICNHVEKHDYVDIIPHSYAAVVTAPTCTEQGYTTYTCACGDTYVDDYVDIAPHNMGAWEMVTDSTCTEKGEEKRTCLDCDYFETRPIDEHHYEATVKPMTCVSDGVTIHTCKDCGDTYYTDIIQCRGHHEYGYAYYDYDSDFYRKDCYYCDHYIVNDNYYYGWDEE